MALRVREHHRDALRDLVHRHGTPWAPDPAPSGPRAAGEQISLIEVFRAEVPPERWPYVQARLRGEELPGAPRPQQVESVRMVEISDEPDADGN